MVLKTHLEPFREPLRFHLWDSKRTLFSKSVNIPLSAAHCASNVHVMVIISAMTHDDTTK